jgi:hypothetical protein
MAATEGALQKRQGNSERRRLKSPVRCVASPHFQERFAMPNWILNRPRLYVALIYTALIVIGLSGCGSLREGADSTDFFNNLSRWGHLQEDKD